MPADSAIRPFVKKALRPGPGTEGEKTFRGTTSDSRRPHRRTPRGVPTNSRAITGASGARLLGRKAVGVPAPRCIRRPLLSPFHHVRGSLCSPATGTLPLLCCILVALYPILSKMSTGMVNYPCCRDINTDLQQMKKAKNRILIPGSFDSLPPRPAVLPRSAEETLSHGCRR